MIWNYLKVAFRELWRNKVFSFINLLGPALGIACAMLILLFTNDELSFDRFHQNGNRVFRIVSDYYSNEGQKIGGGGFTGYFHGPTFAEKFRIFNRLSGINLPILM